jgi:hypothetical protein
MVKALGTLIFRGILGVLSIATTAVITVMVQRYLYEQTGTPALILAPDLLPASPSKPSETGEQLPQTHPQANSPDSLEVETGVSGAEIAPDAGSGAGLGAVSGVASKDQGDRPAKIMEQFWDKLNR